MNASEKAIDLVKVVVILIVGGIVVLEVLAVA